MAFVAKVAPQLQSTACTASADCGPSSVIAALYLASQGAWMPSTGTYVGTNSSRGSMVTRIRKAGGISTLCSGTGYPIGSSVSSLATAFNTIVSQDFAGVGLKTITAGHLSGSSYAVSGPGGFDASFRPQLEAGKHALVLIGYAPIDLYNNHAITGSCNGTFTHIMCVTAYRLVGTVPWVTIIDPLADGRYSGSCSRVIASGPQQVPLSTLKSAMGNSLSTGSGGAQAFTFSAAAPLSVTNDAPIARATATATGGQVPFTVSFSASTSTDPNGNPMTYAWDLDGDGLYDDSTSVAPSKTFTTAGQYPIGLRVTDSLGASDTDSLLISATDAPPGADVDPFPYDPCAVGVLPV